MKIGKTLFSEKRDQWNAIRLRDYTDNFTGNAADNFFPKVCYNTHKKHVKREPGLFKEDFRRTQILC